MGLQELKLQLKQYPTVISLRGREDLLREDALAAIFATFAPDKDLRDFNVAHYRGAPDKAARAALAEEPVGASFRLALLDTEDPDAWLAQKPQSTVLVALDVPFTHSQLDIDCRRLGGKVLKIWVHNESRRAGVKLDKADVDLLLANSGGSLRKLRGDIFKLALYGEAFGLDVVRAAAQSSLHNTGWDILRHVLAADLAKAADALARVRATGGSLLLVLAALQHEFQNLRLLHVGAVDLPEFDVERLERLKARLPPKTVDLLLQDLLDAEALVKRGDDQLVDLRLLVRLTRRIVA